MAGHTPSTEAVPVVGLWGALAGWSGSRAIERWGELCVSHKNDNGDGVTPQRKSGVLRGKAEYRTPGRLICHSIKASGECVLGASPGGQQGKAPLPSSGSVSHAVLRGSQ